MLSKAFDKNPSIIVEVHLEEYRDVIQNTEPIHTEQSLVTSADEVLKYLKRKIQTRENGKDFNPRSDKH